MSDKIYITRKGRTAGASRDGMGFVIATAFGTLGLLSAIVVWSSGAGIVWSLVTYLLASPLLLGAALLINLVPRRPAAPGLYLGKSQRSAKECPNV